MESEYIPQIDLNDSITELVVDDRPRTWKTDKIVGKGPWLVQDDTGDLIAECPTLEKAQFVAEAIHSLLSKEE